MSKTSVNIFKVIALELVGKCQDFLARSIEQLCPNLATPSPCICSF